VVRGSGQLKSGGLVTKCEKSRENLAVFRVGLREDHAGAL